VGVEELLGLFFVEFSEHCVAGEFLSCEVQDFVGCLNFDMAELFAFSVVFEGEDEVDSR
jgi:hypothetical protein